MKNLKKEEKILSDKLNSYKRQLELVEELPNVVKKYEGKYFKERNSYGSGDSWFIYYYVEKVLDLTIGIATSIQLTSDNKFEIETDRRFYLNAAKHEISAEEFSMDMDKFRGYTKKVFKKLTNNLDK